MAGLKFYRILTFILLPFAGYLTLNIVSSLIMSIGNVALLLANFILACLPIYIFTSSYFLFNGIFKAKSCKYVLKDWIKVNAFVSILFAVFMILGSLAILIALSDKTIAAQILGQFDTKNFPGIDKISKDQFFQLLKIFLGVMLPFSILLLVHIVFTFKAIKLYGHVFDEG